MYFKWLSLFWFSFFHAVNTRICDYWKLISSFGKFLCSYLGMSDSTIGFLEKLSNRTSKGMNEEIQKRVNYSGQITRKLVMAMEKVLQRSMDLSKVIHEKNNQVQCLIQNIVSKFYRLTLLKRIKFCINKSDLYQMLSLGTFSPSSKFRPGKPFPQVSPFLLPGRTTSKIPPLRTSTRQQHRVCLD